MKSTHTWILLRGLIRGSFHWHHFPKLLANARPDDTVICIDLPGNGERYQEQTPWSIEAMADQLEKDIEFELKRTNCTDSHIHLIAISMGGMIAAEIANRNPDRFASLHIINSSFANLNPPWQRMRLPALGHLLLRLWRPQSREQAILKCTSNQVSTHRLLDSWVGEAKRHPVSLRNTLAQLLAASRYAAPLDSGCSNTHIYASQNDQLVNVLCSQNLAQHWKLDCHQHPSAGHDLPLDEPDWLIQQILNNSQIKQAA